MKENSERGIKNCLRNLKLCMSFTAYISPKIRMCDRPLSVHI